MPTLNETTIRQPDVDLNIYKPKEPIEVPIVKSVITTDSASPNFVRHIEFDVSGTDLEKRVVPGQALGVLAQGEDENGRPHKVRLYSICSPTGGEDGEGKIYATTVKRVIDEHWETQELFTGVCSNYLCSRKPGDRILMTGPSGKRFILPANPGEYNYIFLATGTGIAPFRGMAIDLMRKGSPTGTENEVVLIFGCPYRTDLLYKPLFEQLDEQHKNFHYLKAISREDPRPDGTKPYVQYSLIDQKELLLPILRKENTLIYVCGLKGMETGIFRILGLMGLYEYMRIGDELRDVNPLDWSRDQLKGIKAGERMFLEVY
jgi:ferredoxin--NADP+ reductase